MNANDFTVAIEVDQTAEQVFKAVNNVKGWWSEEIEGGTEKQGEAFLYHYKDVHIAKMKLIEVIPSNKVVWLVLENYFNFISDQSEWKNTKIIFEITRTGNRTKLVFTHEGLVPAYECYKICFDAWTNYITKSLYNLITTGKGQPNPKEGGFNEALLSKWNIK